MHCHLSHLRDIKTAPGKLLKVSFFGPNFNSTTYSSGTCKTYLPSEDREVRTHDDRINHARLPSFQGNFTKHDVLGVNSSFQLFSQSPVHSNSVLQNLSPSLLPPRLSIRDIEHKGQLTPRKKKKNGER